MNLFKKSDKKINVRSILPKFILLWNRIHKFVFAIFFVALVVLGAYIWYQSIYSGQWSADKKQQYLDSQEKSVTLKEREFNKTLDDIAERKKSFDADYQPIRDVFVPYPGAPTESNR